MDPAQTDRVLAQIKDRILQAKELIRELDNSREKSLVLTKLDEAELWMLRLGA